MPVYDWKTLPEEQLNARLSRRMIHTRNLTIARLSLLKYAIVPLHSHANEQVSMVQQGVLKFNLDGEEKVVRAGEMVYIPSDVPHTVEALEDSVAVDIFAPAREDWIRGDDAYLRR